jgi:Hypothetical glycosyl hydrolase family 15
MTRRSVRAGAHRRAWLTLAGLVSLLLLLPAACGLVSRQPAERGPVTGAQSPRLQDASPFRRGVWLLLEPDEQRAACQRQRPEHYRYIVVQWYTRNDSRCPLERIRAAHPHARVLAYQNLGAMIAGPHTDGRPSTCVTQEEAAAHDAATPGDSWRLHDSTGTVLRFRDEHAFLQPANVGRGSYQRQCLHRLERIKQDGYDGILADDVNVAPGHGLDEAGGGTSIAEYPTDDAYGEAVVQALRRIGPDAERLGLLVIPNVAAEPGTPAQRARTLELVRASSGLFWEFWTRWNGAGPGMGEAVWEASVTLAQAVQQLGKPFLANTYQGSGPSGAAAEQQYAAASFWLAWDGRQDSAWGYNLPGRPEASYSAAWGPDLGAPLEPDRVAVGVGWRRRYTAGIAIANPSPSREQRFELHARYRRPDGVPVTTVVLPPLSGMVLVAGGRT